MQIKTRLRINSMVVFTMMIVMVLFFIQFRRQTVQSDQNQALVEAMRKIAFERITLRDEYFIYQSERANLQWQAKTEHFRQLLEKAQQTFTKPSDAKILKEIERSFRETIVIFHELIKISSLENNLQKKPVPFYEAQKRLVSQILLKAYVLIDRIGRLLASTEEASDAAQKQLNLLFGIFVAVVAVVTIGNSVIIDSLLARRIAALFKGTKIIGEGNLDYHIDVPGNDELSGLARSSNEMAMKLKESYASKENLEREITRREQAEDDIRKLNTELEERVHDRTAQLEAANKELEAFSYSVSHDLRAPLRGIDGWSLALLDDFGEKLDDQAQTYLSRVRAETQQMGRLIDDLLKLSRVTRKEMQMKRIDLTALAQGIAVHLQEEEAHRKIEFVIEPALETDGDESLLGIVLTNLFDNAVKFTGPRSHARIQFGLSEADGSPVFFVRDNGVGFDMAYVSKLFGAFQRLHKSSEFPGTGIGLATVQRIIHRHGGRIWVEAEMGQGATFYFTLKEAV